MSSARLPKLKDNHRVFADHYLLSGNAAESYRKSGGKGFHASLGGYKCLNRPDVQAYLAIKREQSSEEVTDLHAKVLRELDTMAFSNIADFITVRNGIPEVDFSTATPDQLRAIASVKTKHRSIRDNKGKVIATETESGFALADKYRGLELIGKHLGMFKADEQRVVIDVADRLLQARRRLAELPDMRGEES